MNDSAFPGSGSLSRRAFAGVACLTAAAAAAPVLANVRRIGTETIVGTGPHTFRVRHNFPQLPDRFTWQTTHNVAVDAAGNLYVIHEGRTPSIVVTDRAHDTLQIFSIDGVYQETLTGFGLPANIDTWKNLMLVPELKACVTLLDEKNAVVAQLGRAVERLDAVKDLRSQPDKWLDGEFVHPHDACFTPEGDIFVAEWVSTGRITKLERVG